MSFPSNAPAVLAAVKRVRIFQSLLLIAMALIGVRLFYLQIIQYSHYHQAALQQQLKQYQIPAERGIIEAHDGDGIVPLVLNQKLYDLVADPVDVKQYKQSPAEMAANIANVIGGSVSDYQAALTAPNTRYSVLAKKITPDQEKKIMAYKYPGLYAEEQDYRTYPDGSMAAQVLGFVNNAGEGTYGIEQALNSQLAGKPGMMKAITDVQGVPLLASGDNTEMAPTPGKNVVLTLDMSIQKQVEQILKSGLQKANSPSGSIIIMNPNNGAIVAMADYPTYDPANYQEVTDPRVFNNASVASQLEVGSIMKVLTVAAGLDQGVIQPDTTYQDSGSVTIDGSTIKNVLPLPSPTVSIEEILELSLNTGAVHVLSELGGGQLNAKARNVWYDYLTNHYQFGKPTGIEQSYEAVGSVPDPNKGYGLNLQYANTAFGQGISVTMLQMTAALSSVLNGGTYYQPHLVDGYVDDNGNFQKEQPKIVRKNVVKPQVGPELAVLMKQVFDRNHLVYSSNLHEGYAIGGKTGTAQIPLDGGYDPNLFNGTFLGYVGGDKPQYVIAILTKAPKLPGYEYAGSEGAAPLFGQVADMLVNSGKVTPMSHP